jgi:hypothetical protein
MRVGVVSTTLALVDVLRFGMWFTLYSSSMLIPGVSTSLGRLFTPDSVTFQAIACVNTLPRTPAMKPGWLTVRPCQTLTIPSRVGRLRHTFGSQLIQSGTSTVYVKEQMGTPRFR